MADNQYQYNRNLPLIGSSTESCAAVIVVRIYKPLYLWMFAVSVIGLICTLVLFVFLPRLETAGHYRFGARPSSAPNFDSNSLVSDVELLKGRMNHLITGTMETKIHKLEQSLKSGIISRNDLTTIQELREDLQVLKAHSLRNASTTLQVDQRGARINAQTALHSQRLLNEFSKIKNLFYISIASWGGLILIIGGAWLRGYYRLGQIQNERLVGSPMLEKPQTGVS